MSKVIFTGVESAGKSLKLAMTAEKILLRNLEWKNKYKFTRPMAFNFPLTKKFTARAEKAEIPIIYWEHLSELVKLKGCDLFIDEVANYFDSRNWADLPRDAKKWIRQGAKMGIQLYGASQKFGAVDKAFRELTNELYSITKIIGSTRPGLNLPKIKKIWGLCMMTELDPQEYDEQDGKFSRNFSLPRFFVIRKEYCEIFDTNQEIPDLRQIECSHLDVFCPHENKIVKTIHR